MPLPSIATTGAPAARMMTARPAFSILFSTGVTLAEHYWVTSRERQSVHEHTFTPCPAGKGACKSVDKRSRFLV